ncbi:Peptidoglycan/xylan/chitin deacetylase, PgdA/CDA1 family [Lutibacter agarilyticus]|uniref:Peptidoglycan/xylan/chitin deacetylase, PgdA/CDA1 family n=1 Tax=Lutibacter agarilyticus TaxID=1109740 RepID=A0A238X8K7_9FLAO|nr:polysaccharide deacetylase family protein [Lutibacter agarilyticus]SNR54901.1 Peptidoglycan/xylan/chitin deacetylase, PgdA/CDA1 family [Lutibacter agarilyticus]
MKKYIIKTPSLVKLFFNNWVWSFSSKEKTLYLTFDDGPTPEITNWTLNTLKEHNAKATFFCIGKNIAKYPEIYEKIKAQNHTVGNHTNNHLNGYKTTATTYLENIDLSEENSGEKLNLFRPPYGKLKLSQAEQIRKKGYKIVMWDVLSADFDTKITSEECLANVIKNVKNGSIIVFHDSVKASEKLKFVLPKILEFYKAKGYTFNAIN